MATVSTGRPRAAYFPRRSAGDDQPTPPRRWTSRVLSAQVLIPAVCIIVVGYLVLVPLYFLLDTAFFKDGQFGLGNIVAAFGNANAIRLLGNTLLFGVASSAIAVLLGSVTAYLAVRTDVPFKGLIFGAAIVPLVVPGILYTVSWIFLGSPRIGIYSSLLPEGTFNIYSMVGMILVESLNLAPLTFLMLYATLRSMDPSLEEAAYVSGASLRVTLLRVTGPLMWPGIFGAGIITLVRAMESFEVPAVLGLPAGTFVFTSQIFRTVKEYPPAYGQASVYALALLAMCAALIYAESRLTRNAKAFQTVTGKGYRSRAMPLGRWRWPAALFVLVYFLFSVAMPLLVLTFQSLQPFFTRPSVASLSRLTFENYTNIFTERRILDALQNSLVLGVLTATAVMFVLAIISWVVTRTKFRGRVLLDNLAFLPITIPGIVLGTALLIVYLRIPLPIYGTMVILFIAYATRYMPYGLRYSHASLRQVSADLEEAAAVSGASWWQTYRRVTLPLIMPGFIAGWIFIFVVSIRELSQSILLYSPGNEVLAVIMWENLSNGDLTQLSALGMVMVAISAALIPIARWLGGRLGIRV